MIWQYLKEGIIDIGEIKVPKDLKITEKNRRKVEDRIKEYKDSWELSPVILNDDLMLKEKLTSYLAAKELGLNKIPYKIAYIKDKGIDITDIVIPQEYLYNDTVIDIIKLNKEVKNKCQFKKYGYLNMGEIKLSKLKLNCNILPLLRQADIDKANTQIKGGVIEPVYIDEDKRVIGKHTTFIIMFIRGKGRVPYIQLTKNDIDQNLKNQRRIYDSSNDIDRLMYRQGSKCFICGRPLEEEEYSIDHLIPTSLGGENTIENKRLVCKRCNMLKGCLLPSRQLFELIKKQRDLEEQLGKF